MFNLSSFQIQGGGVGIASDGDQDLLRFKGDNSAGFVPADYFGSHGGGLHGLHRALQVELHTHLLHMGHPHLREVAIQHGQHAVLSFDHRDLGAKGRISAGQL